MTRFLHKRGWIDMPLFVERAATLTDAGRSALNSQVPHD